MERTVSSPPPQRACSCLLPVATHEEREQRRALELHGREMLEPSRAYVALWEQQGELVEEEARTHATGAPKSPRTYRLPPDTRVPAQYQAPSEWQLSLLRYR